MGPKTARLLCRLVHAGHQNYFEASLDEAPVSAKIAEHFPSVMKAPRRRDQVGEGEAGHVNKAGPAGRPIGLTRAISVTEYGAQYTPYKVLGTDQLYLSHLFLALA